MTREWNSPYQYKPFNDALIQTGVSVETVPVEKASVFFSQLTSEVPTAWEVDLPVTRKDIPNGFDLWKYSGSSHTSVMSWNDTDYFTPVVTNNHGFRDNYRDSNLRNIRKAVNFGLTHEVVPANTNTGPLLELFTQREELRGGIGQDVFNALVPRLIANQAADCHIVRLDKQIASVAVVIKSEDVANLRFVASDPGLLHTRPVNFLYDCSIKHYFDRGFGRVDLSGTVPPTSNDPKLLNISQFKYGFTRQIVTFNHL
ncbi:MAG: GNAT family N-acetyltransferase [Candidatus Shapirobacteria bacterium]|jgi:hypothetical protein|nr:GNAT family N-acetyltransferase [Candidatus Shapirobacteria bacterium]